jgi:hypothetical protein
VAGAGEDGAAIATGKAESVLTSGWRSTFCGPERDGWMGPTGRGTRPEISFLTDLVTTPRWTPRAQEVEGATNRSIATAALEQSRWRGGRSA